MCLFYFFPPELGDRQNFNICSRVTNEGDTDGSGKKWSEPGDTGEDRSTGLLEVVSNGSNDPSWSMDVSGESSGEALRDDWVDSAGEQKYSGDDDLYLLGTGEDSREE